MKIEVPDVERLIEQLKHRSVCRDQFSTCVANWPDKPEKWCAGCLGLLAHNALIHQRDALSAAHTREAEQQEGLAKIGELLQTGGMTDAHYLAGAVRAVLEREAALRAELDAARQLYYGTCRAFDELHAERNALRAENERISKAHDEALIELEKAGWPCRLAELPALFRETEAHVARLEAENAIAKAAYQEMHDAACEAAAQADAAEAALKEQQVAHREGET